MLVDLANLIRSVFHFSLISILAVSAILALPLNSSALSKDDLNSHLDNNASKHRSSIPTELNLSIQQQLRQTTSSSQSKSDNISLNSTFSPLSLQGETYASPLTSSSPSPTVGGYIPSYCYGVGIIIFTDTANLDTGEGLFVYTSDTGEVAVETGFVNDYRVWSLNLATNGLGLIKGKYNIYVSTPCDDNEYGYNSIGRDYSNPLFSDVHFGVLSIVPTACNEACTPVYRFYNIQNGAHFYTSNDSEKRTLLETAKQYRYEGIVNFGKTSQEEALIPVHRFYNLKTGTHFYTASQSEATRVNNTMSATYRYEGIAYYTHSGPAANTSPVHRFYKFNQGVHFFTSNQSEATTVNNAMSNTYRYEGVSYYNIANE